MPESKTRLARHFSFLDDPEQMATRPEDIAGIARLLQLIESTAVA